MHAGWLHTRLSEWPVPLFSGLRCAEQSGVRLSMEVCALFRQLRSAERERESVCVYACMCVFVCLSESVVQRQTCPSAQDKGTLYRG